LAISPWQSFYSRFSHDAILGLFLVLIGAYIFFKIIKRNSLFALGVLIVILIPFGKMMLGPEGLTRAKMIFIASDENISYQLHKENENLQGTANLFDNNFVILGNFWAKRYLNYWDPGFLFFNGMNFTRTGWPGTGLFYFFEIPAFIIGIFLLFFTEIIKDSKVRKLIIFWLLLGPLAASLANNDQHASRSLTTIPIP